MITRSCIVLLHLLTLNEVSLQEPIVGSIGGSAVLPCSSQEPQLKPQEITVRWRYNDSLNVHDIIDGEGNVKDQHPAYKDRAEIFPEKFKEGNFSLKLNNLQNNDTGKFFCYTSDIQSVELLVKEKSNQVAEKTSQRSGERNQGAQSRPEKIVTTVSLLSVFILLSIGLFTI